MLKKLTIIAAGMMLTLGLSTSSFAYYHWHTRHVWTNCSGGVCHKYMNTYNKRCQGGSCHVWRNHYHWKWRR